MSLNVGGIYVACSDRDRVVELIREYWLKRGATPMARDPLDIEPLSLESSGELGFVVSPPTCVENGDGQQWIAIYDSERYHGDSELAEHLAKELNTSAVIYGMHGASDIAEIKGFGVPLSDLPACLDGDEEEYEEGEEEEEEDDDDDCEDGCCAYGGDWGEIESYVCEKFPFPFLYYNQLKDDENITEFMSDWSVFGFEQIPHIPDAGYSGPDTDTIRFESEKRELKECVERGDLARIEEIYAANPRIQYETLSAIAGTSCDTSSPTIRRLIFAFAERIFAQNSYWMVEHVAEAALLEDNAQLFDRACAQLGERTAGFAPLAWKLLQAKDVERGYKVLRAVVSSPKASPVDWNNLAYALIPLVESCRPADLDHLMTEAGKHGPVNPFIWHNVACVWAKAGEIDRAIEAVACARRDGYEKMDDLAKDDDLAALRLDPRFAEALNGGGERLTLSSLVRTVTRQGATRVVNRPVAAFSFSVPFDDGAAFGQGAAAILRRYCAEAPEGALGAYCTQGGPWKPLTEKAMSRHIEQFSEIGSEGGASVHALYRGAASQEAGDATPYAVNIEYTRFDDGEGWRSIDLYFPVEEAERPEALIRRFLAYAALVPYETARCGFAMLTSSSTYCGNAEHEHWSKQMNERFYGFQPALCWLTLVGSGPLARIGGRESLVRLTPSAVVMDAPQGGVCLRAALYPPVGLNTEPNDIGAMPEIARALRRLEIGGAPSADEALALDELTNGACINPAPAL